MTTAALTAESVLESNFQAVQTTQEQPQRHKKNWLSWAFKKAADVGARALLTNTIKIAAATTVLGAGASTFLTIGVTMVATGVGAGLYSYLKDYAVARWHNEEVDFWDKQRLKKAKWALLTGAAGGAFGAWLAGTETFQSGLSFVKDYGLKALDSLTDKFMSAHAAPIVALAAAPVLAAVDVAPKAPTSLSKVWDMSMQSDQAKGKLMAQMLLADPEKLNSVSPQFLKDRAHDLLRMKDIPLEERVQLAKDLATQAKARGNKQAVQFLKDLVKLERFPKLGVLKDAVISAPKVIVPVEALATLPQIALPEVTLLEMTLPEVAAAVPEVVAAAPEVVVAEPEVQVATAPETIAPAAVDAAPVEEQAAVVSREAAHCNITGPDANGTYDADCKALKAEMQPGDFVTFSLDGVTDETPLLEESVAMKTEDFLHEKVVADGIQKISVKRTAALAMMP